MKRLLILLLSLLALVEFTNAQNDTVPAAKTTGLATPVSLVVIFPIVFVVVGVFFIIVILVAIGVSPKKKIKRLLRPGEEEAY